MASEYSDTEHLHSDTKEAVNINEPPPPAYQAASTSSGYNQTAPPSHHQHQPLPNTAPIVLVHQSQIVQARIGRNGVPLDDWQIGICDGCHDMGNWCMSCFCPCLLSVKAAQRLDENCLFPFFCGTYPLQIRFRTLVGIKQSMCDEATLFCLCPTCSVLRLVNEMDERGFDMQRS